MTGRLIDRWIIILKKKDEMGLSSFFSRQIQNKVTSLRQEKNLTKKEKKKKIKNNKSNLLVGNN